MSKNHILNFDPSPDDIQRICHFFSLGKLREFKKEEGNAFSRPHSIVFAATSQGQYTFKFYPTEKAPEIAVEYAVNRILVKHHFPTPAMHKGLDHQLFVSSNGLVAVCYSYIEGVPAWKYIKQGKTIPFKQINAAMLSLKDTLSAKMKPIPALKQKGLTATINTLAQVSRTLAPYDQKETIDASLQDACRTYQHHQSLFTRQWLHSDAGLNNFLVHKKTIYTLDLEAVQKDYVLSDLACLVSSCLSLDIPAKTIKTIINGYFTQHNIGPELFPVLHTLVQIKLVKKYLKNMHRKSILALLKKMNGCPGFIV